MFRLSEVSFIPANSFNPASVIFTLLVRWSEVSSFSPANSFSPASVTCVKGNSSEVSCFIPARSFRSASVNALLLKNRASPEFRWKEVSCFIPATSLSPASVSLEELTRSAVRCFSRASSFTFSSVAPCNSSPNACSAQATSPTLQANLC